MSIRGRIVSALLLTLLLSACVNLEPVEDDLRVYARWDLLLSVPKRSFEDLGQVVYIARPDLPSYLTNNRMLIRAADEIQSLEGARWVEPLEEGVARALGEYLARAQAPFVAGYYPGRASSATLGKFACVSANYPSTRMVVCTWSLAGRSRRTGSCSTEASLRAWSTSGRPASPRAWCARSTKFRTNGADHRRLAFRRRPRVLSVAEKFLALHT